MQSVSPHTCLKIMVSLDRMQKNSKIWEKNKFRRFSKLLYGTGVKIIVFFIDSVYIKAVIQIA